MKLIFFYIKHVEIFHLVTLSYEVFDLPRKYFTIYMCLNQVEQVGKKA